MEIKDMEAVRAGLFLIALGFMFSGNIVGLIGLGILSYGMGVLK